MLRLVMKHVAPEDWECATYDDKTYRLFQLEQYDEEFFNVIRHFNDRRHLVKSLKRIQNPFQLGSFFVRKEQKEYRGEVANILTYYHPLHKTDLETALDYNMDVRRYEHKYSGNHTDNQKPKFFKTPSAAADAIPECEDKVILVSDILGSRSNENWVTSKDNDAEYRPTYVVSLRNW